MSDTDHPDTEFLWEKFYGIYEDGRELQALFCLSRFQRHIASAAFAGTKHVHGDSTPHLTEPENLLPVFLVLGRPQSPIIHPEV